jgi:hypothetical protein
MRTEINEWKIYNRVDQQNHSCFLENINKIDKIQERPMMEKNRDNKLPTPGMK